MLADAALLWKRQGCQHWCETVLKGVQAVLHAAPADIAGRGKGAVSKATWWRSADDLQPIQQHLVS